MAVVRIKMANDAAVGGCANEETTNGTPAGTPRLTLPTPLASRTPGSSATTVPPSPRSPWPQKVTRISGPQKNSENQPCTSERWPAPYTDAARA